MAEGVGFEPTIRYNRIPDFESGAFDHSATLPCGSLSYFEGRILTKDWRFCTSLTKFFVASINRTVLRKQPPPSSEKSVGHTSRKKRGNQRSFSNTVDRTEKNKLIMTDTVTRNTSTVVRIVPNDPPKRCMTAITKPSGGNTSKRAKTIAETPSPVRHVPKKTCMKAQP